MKRLTALPAVPTYLDRYVAIRDKKHGPTKTQLVAAHALVTQRYADHAQAVALDELHALQHGVVPAPVDVALRACYGSATQPLKQLKQAIRDAQAPRQLKYCPMCGTTLPTTFDHYLPAARFPEFAVHGLNLIPCCALCNSTKDDDWLGQTGRRQFLHAYLDALPDVQFVKVTLHETPPLPGVGATFSLERPPAVDQAPWDLIATHFARLKLLARYNERGNAEVAEILADCREFSVHSGGADVAGFLHGRVQDRRNAHGRNHWIVVLMEALALHPKLRPWTAAA